MRFLDPETSKPRSMGWGISHGVASTDPISLPGNLAGTKEGDTMIDLGCNFDGFMTAKLLRQWTGQMHSPLNGEAHSPDAVFAGHDYSDIHLTENDDGNGIGLSFLARHLADD